MPSLISAESTKVPAHYSSMPNSSVLGGEQLIGESLGIVARDEVATKLAEDTEFRTREVIQARVAPHRCRSSVIAGSFDMPSFACNHAQLGGFAGSCEVHAPCQTDEVVSSRCEQRASNAQCRGALVSNSRSCGCSAAYSFTLVQRSYTRKCYCEPEGLAHRK